MDELTNLEALKRLASMVEKMMKNQEQLLEMIVAVSNGATIHVADITVINDIDDYEEFYKIMRDNDLLK